MGVVSSGTYLAGDKTVHVDNASTKNKHPRLTNGASGVAKMIIVGAGATPASCSILGTHTHIIIIRYTVMSNSMRSYLSLKVSGVISTYRGLLCRAVLLYSLHLYAALPPPLPPRPGPGLTSSVS